MRAIVFAKRNFKEIVRDPVNLVFLIFLPLFLLVLFQQFNIPNDVYNINNFAPSIIIFSFGFISLFSSQLVAKDRTTSLLNRLFTSPMLVKDYIFGYTLSLLPIALVQSILFLLVGLLFGLEFSIHILITILISLFVSLLFIALGILIGCLCNDKQAPGFGSIVIQLIAFTSGMWFDIDMMSKGFKIVSNALPFRYNVDLMRYTLNGIYDKFLIPLMVTVVFTILVFMLAMFVFKKRMLSDNK